MPSLHNLQLFLLPHTEALSHSAETSTRLYFLAGPRLITHLTATHNQITQAASILSCGTLKFLIGFRKWSTSAKPQRSVLWILNRS